jgi:hypothetical protein
MAFTDSFTNANGTDLVVHNAKWIRRSQADEVLEIQSNAVSNIPFEEIGAAYYYNETFNSKHYSKCKYLSNLTVGPAIRVDEGVWPNWSCYYCFPDDKIYNGEMINDTGTDWDSGLTLPDVNSIIELTVDATTEGTVHYKDDGTTVATYTGKTALTGGRAGLSKYGNITGAAIDDWEGGDVGGSTRKFQRASVVGA